MLEYELREAVKQLGKSLPVSVVDGYNKRLSEGSLTKDENSASHFCAYFLPFNLQTKQVMFGHHKKSGKWLSPGGHIDGGESLFDTLNREIEEELGVKDFFIERPVPFLLTITPIEHDPRACKMHFDVWHLMETDGNAFKIDMSEYHEVRWLSVSEAKKLTTDPANEKALSFLAKNY
jgi:8-oxo-dGTP pyrophosphatase MutT (NUDIX family)